MTLTKRLVTAIATVAIIAGTATPAFAATDVTVSENGAFSATKTKVKNTKVTTVKQSNSSSITTVVNSTANSGHNTSNFNTGGTSGVSTGNANSTVNVSVGGSSNTANLSSDCECNDTTVNVKKNGAFSHNSVQVKNSSWLTVLQSNVTEVLNVVTGKTNTGGNDSNFNTDGNSPGETGNATSNVTVTVTGSSNTATH